jgi:hypothetical protein
MIVMGKKIFTGHDRRRVEAVTAFFRLFYTLPPSRLRDCAQRLLKVFWARRDRVAAESPFDKQRWQEEVVKWMRWFERQQPV